MDHVFAVAREGGHMHKGRPRLTHRKPAPTKQATRANDVVDRSAKRDAHESARLNRK